VNGRIPEVRRWGTRQVSGEMVKYLADLMCKKYKKISCEGPGYQAGGRSQV
jgi:hypothetical protein